MGDAGVTAGEKVATSTYNVCIVLSDVHASDTCCWLQLPLFLCCYRSDVTDDWRDGCLSVSRSHDYCSPRL